MLPADDSGGRTAADDTIAIDIEGAPGWRYHPFEAPAGDGAITITAEREDGLTVTFSVPAFVTRGDELGELTRIVIRARERMERAEGLGA